MKNKILFIGNTDMNRTMFEGNRCVDCREGFWSHALLNRMMRRIRPLVGLSLSDWKRDLGSYGCVVISDQGYRNGMVPYLKKKDAKCRVIVYLRNSMMSIHSYKYKIDFEEIRNFGAELWSYNKNDCKEYGYRYNRQFFNPYLPKRYGCGQCDFDLVFLGDEKGRGSTLDRIYTLCTAQGIKTYFNIIGSTAGYNRNIGNRFMPYKEYLQKIVARSRAVLDIVTEINYGLTLRPLEAVFFRKKLVTTYKEIKYEDFYKKENIFIIGEDRWSDLKDFIMSPYEEVDRKICERYTVASWYQTFMDG